jgi:non-ribosomal peptide synthetase component F
LIVPHNLIWDGWSFDIFLRELCAQYAAAIDGRPSSLPDLAISYPDFAEWQSEWLGSDRSAAQRRWWQAQLDGTLPILELPSDRPRPVELSLAVTHIQTRLSRDQVEALSAISGQLGGTLFTILFAAFCVLLHRLSGQNDLLVGTPVHARTRPETEDVIGLFMNMLVLRSRMNLAWTFTELLGRVRHMTLDAFGHQELPLEALDVRAPILRAFFTMEDGRQRPDRMGRLQIVPISVMPPALAADLRLAATHTTDGVSIVWTCSSELFDSATTERLLRRFETLLGDVIRDPRRRLGELDMISVEERGLLETFGQPKRATESVVSVLTQFEHQARRRSDAPAIVSGSEVIDYGQLDRRAANLSRVLQARGIHDGSRVGVFLPRSPDFVTGVLAAMKAGAIGVSLDPDHPPARIAAIVEHSGVELVLTNDALRHLIVEGAARLVSIEEAEGAESESPEPAAAAVSAGRIDTTACLLYTTHTYRLRAARLSHRTLAAVVAAVTGELGLTKDDVALAINLPSVGASIIELLAPLSVGARVVIAGGDTGSDTEELAAIIPSSAATVVIAPTSLWADLLVASARPWPRLKAICVGDLPAAATRAELVSRTAGAWIAHGFPEAGVWATLGRLSDSQPAGFLGRPLRHVPVRILESGFGEAPLGVAGELHIGVGGDFWADGETSGARGEGAPIHDGSWYRTGERARWRSDGTLELVAGRKRETYVDGVRVDLEDISSLLRRDLLVQDAAASFQAADADHRRLVAYLEPREGVAYTATELREQLRRVLPDRMVPRSFIEVETIVRTAGGGLDLESRGATGVPSGDDAPPSSAMEILLAELWKDALCVPRVSVHDNFFELGGYSLLCFQVLDRLERKTGHRVSPRLLLLDSLQQVAAQLDAIPKAGDEHQSPKASSTRGGFFRRFSRFLPGAV